MRTKLGIMMLSVLMLSTFVSACSTTGEGIQKTDIIHFLSDPPGATVRLSTGQYFFTPPKDIFCITPCDMRLDVIQNEADAYLSMDGCETEAVHLEIKQENYRFSGEGAAIAAMSIMLVGASLGSPIKHDLSFRPNPVDVRLKCK